MTPKLSTPEWQWDKVGWVLILPVEMLYAQGMVRVGTTEVGVIVRNATVYLDDEKVGTRFRTTEDAKTYAMSTFILDQLEEP